MHTFASVRHLAGNRLVLSWLIGLAACALGASAHGQGMLSFAGAAGTPLRITLGQGVTFTLTTAAAAGNTTYFVFQSVGNVFSGRQDSVSGSINFQINGTALIPLNLAGSGLTAGSIASTDLYLFGSMPSAAAGSVITLSAGTDSTPDNIFSAAPAGGTFNVFIANSSGTRLSANGVAVAPEPSIWAQLGVGGLAALGVVGARRRVSGNRA